MYKNLRFLPFIIYFIAAFLSFIVVEEDAFIYFRIAQNMADAYGIVFNRGGETIESGSGLIWQLMLAGIANLPLHLVIATKFLGVFFAGLSLWFLLRISERFIPDKTLAIFPAVFLAASTPFYYWSHRGLETAQFVFVLLWLLSWITSKQKIHLWFIPSFIVFCSRPEGFLMVAAITPWLWIERKNIAYFWCGVFVLALLVLGVELWRLWYFHDLLPHAFYHKMGGGFEKRFSDFVQYGLWNLIWLWLAIAFTVVVFLKKAERQWLPIFFLFVMTAVWGIIGADWKSFNRQLSSWLPFVFLLMVIPLQYLNLTQWRRKTLLSLLALYGFYLFVFCPYTSAQGQIRTGPTFTNLEHFFKAPLEESAYILQSIVNPEDYFDSYEPVLAGDHIGFNRNATVGRFIQQNYPQGVTVIFDQMGQAPWYGGLDKTFIDNTGLTDKQIGYYDFLERSRGSQVFSLYRKMLFNLKYFLFGERPVYTARDQVAGDLLKMKPELILLRERYVEKFPETILGKVFYSNDFKKNYRRSFYINKRDVIYERNDLKKIVDPIVPNGALVEF